MFDKPTKRRDKVFRKPYKPAGKMRAETKRMFAQWPGQKWAGSKWAVFMNPGGLLHLCCMRCKRKERHSRGQPFPKMIVILLYRCRPAARFCEGKRKPLPAPCAFKASQPGTARPPPAGSVRAKVRRKGPVRRHSLPLRYTCLLYTSKSCRLSIHSCTPLSRATFAATDCRLKYS